MYWDFGLERDFSRIDYCIFLTKFRGLMGKVVNVGNKGRITLIFWCSFALSICLICVGGGIFPNTKDGDGGGTWEGVSVGGFRVAVEENL